jgi:hypothetical protein
VYLIFGMPLAYQVCSVDVTSVLWNWFCFIYRIGVRVLLSGIVFQISGYEHRCYVSFICNLSVLEVGTILTSFRNIVNTKKSQSQYHGRQAVPRISTHLIMA